jgi:hypothetical protein
MVRSRVSKSFLDYALGGTVLLSLGAGLLFFTGWNYLAAYYGSFGLDLSVLNFPIYLFPVAGALKQLWLKEVLLLALMVCGFWVKSGFERQESKRGRRPEQNWISIRPVELSLEVEKRLEVLWFLLFLAVALMVLLPVVAWGTSRVAKKDARRVYQNGGEIRLTFTPAAVAGEEPELLLANKAGRLRFLAQSKDLVVVFEAPQSQDGPGDRKKSVFVVSRTDLLGVHYWYSPSQN